MNQDPLFELTNSPQLNELILRTKDLYAGNITDAQYKETVKALNEYRRSFRTFLRQQVKFTPANEIIKSEVDKLEIELEKLRESLEAIYKYFSDGLKEHIEKGLTDCRKNFEHINQAIAVIQQQDAKAEKYSDAPLQNELMTIGFALLEGKVTPAAFSLKLDLLLKSLKEYYTGFDNLTPAGGEKEYFEENKAEIKSAVRDYIKALEEAREYLYNNNKVHMYKGLEASKLASEKLLAFQEKLGEYHQRVVCIKCGVTSPATEKHCIKCGAVLPVNIEETQTMAFKQDEDGNIKSSSHMESELTLNVSQAVSSVKEGKMSKKEFGGFIGGILEKVKGAQKEKEKLPLPDQLQGKDEASPLFIQIEELIQTGFEDMQEGLDKMSLYASGENESHLIFGLEEFLSGHDRLSQARRLTSQAMTNR